jgi:hypothetical protein
MLTLPVQDVISGERDVARPQSGGVAVQLLADGAAKPARRAANHRARYPRWARLRLDAGGGAEPGVHEPLLDRTPARLERSEAPVGDVGATEVEGSPAFVARLPRPTGSSCVCDRRDRLLLRATTPWP